MNSLRVAIDKLWSTSTYSGRIRYSEMVPIYRRSSCAEFATSVIISLQPDQTCLTILLIYCLYLRPGSWVNICIMIWLTYSCIVCRISADIVLFRASTCEHSLASRSALPLVNLLCFVCIGNFSWIYSYIKIFLLYTESTNFLWTSQISYLWNKIHTDSQLKA